jgi:UDP-N-acetylglucosamine diphosphorylase/glucosamine-1-phosphate N-acetyltransferase
VAGPLIIFEDRKAENLYPLSLTRPVFGLRCGILTLAEKAVIVLGGARGGPEPPPLFHVRDYLSPAVKGAVESYSRVLGGDETALLVNGRVLADAELARAIEPGRPGLYTSGGAIVAATVPGKYAKALDAAVGRPLDGEVLAGLPSREVKARLIEYPWDLTIYNAAEIENDARLLGLGGIAVDLPDGVRLVNEPSISIGPGASIAPGVVLDASDGPVHIAAAATIMANASLKGPVHVGEGSTVKMGACLYGETTIGPACKIGGEVAETIVHGHSNKQHGGFLGHSYLGEWVNLGAGTDTSDLKNNYSNVKVRLDRETVDTGLMFVGLFMGDHSKCGIGTTFNTGTVVGVCCNVFGTGYPPKFMPSFVWGGDALFEEYDPAKALETAGRAMGRRGMELTPEYAAVLKHVFDITRDSRESFIRAA